MSENKNKMCSCPSITNIPDVPECGANMANFHNTYSFDFENKECYQNGKYYGQIIEHREDYIKVEVDNGNRYMKGQIVEFLGRD